MVTWEELRLPPINIWNVPRLQPKKEQMKYYKDEQCILVTGDCLETLRAMKDASVDSIVTDPPYELGFMGKAWDSTGIANSVEMWTEALRVLKPGGHLLAFSGSRTYHRMVCAIEDAGFEIRDQIMWVYGSGFPKSLNVSKALDAYAKTGRSDSQVTGDGRSRAPGQHFKEFRKGGVEGATFNPTDAVAQQWQGWGTALKPAHEPICVARRPLVKGSTVAKNVLAHGTGALNIDGCRVGDGGGTSKAGMVAGAATKNALGDGLNTATFGVLVEGLGRWPANIIHDGSDEVLAGFPFGEAGGAARFFYCAKASKKDRGGGNSHPTVKPTELMAYLCRLVTPPGGTVLDPFMGSGSTGKAAKLEGFKFVGIDLDPEYVEIAKQRISAM
jgi:DNA modification methylase